MKIILIVVLATLAAQLSAVKVFHKSKLRFLHKIRSESKLRTQTKASKTERWLAVFKNLATNQTSKVEHEFSSNVFGLTMETNAPDKLMRGVVFPVEQAKTSYKRGDFWIGSAEGWLDKSAQPTAKEAESNSAKLYNEEMKAFAGKDKVEVIPFRLMANCEFYYQLSKTPDIDGVGLGVTFLVGNEDEYRSINCNAISLNYTKVTIYPNLIKVPTLGMMVDMKYCVDRCNEVKEIVKSSVENALKAYEEVIKTEEARKELEKKISDFAIELSILSELLKKYQELWGGMDMESSILQEEFLNLQKAIRQRDVDYNLNKLKITPLFTD